MERRWTFLLLIAVLSSTAACAGPTRYTGYGGEAEQPPPFGRTVEFEVTGDFYKDPPACAIVMPFEGRRDRDSRAVIVEESVARQLSMHFSRVVGPRARERMVRDLAVDLDNGRDRKVLARAARCGFFLESAPWGDEGVFALVWTQERVGLELRLVRARDGAPLWRARHVATRSEGGVPLSPLSAVYNIVTVGGFKADGDVPISLVDDATRRMLRTLPDTRFAGAGETRHSWR